MRKGSSRYQLVPAPLPALEFFIASKCVKSENQLPFHTMKRGHSSVKCRKKIRKLDEKNEEIRRKNEEIRRDVYLDRVITPVCQLKVQCT